MTQVLAPWCGIKGLHGPHGATPKCPGLKPECKDCGSTTRKLNIVSVNVLLCHSCKLARRRKAKAGRRDSYQQKEFGITLDEGDLIVEFQGGGCICAPWTGYTGKTRALSTDHNHKTGEIRGKLCKHCNDLLGRVRDDPEYFRRMLVYLADPPAVRLLGSRIVPGHVQEDERDDG